MLILKAQSNFCSVSSLEDNCENTTDVSKAQTPKRLHASVSIHLHRTTLGYEQTHPARRSGCTLDHLHPPKKGTMTQY